jgi:cytoskeletal protein CcmA (bactofilin family)
MFKSKEKGSSALNTVSTVIGEGLRIEGALITGANTLRVDGHVIGDISIDGSIIVGESGYIKGNITVTSALFAGKIEGNVSSQSGVHLTSTGFLNGNIVASSIVIDEGAIFSGNCQMSTNPVDTSGLVYNTNVNKEPDDLSKDPNLSFDKG